MSKGLFYIRPLFIEGLAFFVRSKRDIKSYIDRILRTVVLDRKVGQIECEFGAAKEWNIIIDRKGELIAKEGEFCGILRFIIHKNQVDRRINCDTIRRVHADKYIAALSKAVDIQCGEAAVRAVRDQNIVLPDPIEGDIGGVNGFAIQTEAGRKRMRKAQTFGSGQNISGQSVGIAVCRVLINCGGELIGGLVCGIERDGLIALFAFRVVHVCVAVGLISIAGHGDGGLSCSQPREGNFALGIGGSGMAAERNHGTGDGLAVRVLYQNCVCINGSDNFERLFYASRTVVVNFGRGKVGIAGADGDGTPLCLSAAVVDVCEPEAIVKRIIPDGGYAVADHYTGETFAIGKCRIPDGGYAVADHYTGEVAIGKRRIPDGDHAVWNYYTGETAIVKRIISDGGYAVTDHYTGEKVAMEKCRIPDRGYTVTDYYVGKTEAIVKRRIPDGDHAVWNYYTGETVAMRKRQIPDGGYTVTDHYAGETVARIKRPIPDGGYAVVDH